MDRKALFKKWNAHKEHTYDLSETFSLKDDEGRTPDIAFIYSGRNRGKSFEVAAQFLADAYYSNKKMLYIRRNDAPGYEIVRWFAYHSDFIKDMTDGASEDVCYYQGELYLCHYDKTLKNAGKQVRDKKIGFFWAASRYSAVKSQQFPGVYNYAFEEVLTNDHYLTGGGGEPDIVYNIYSTFTRHKKGVRMVLISNLVSIVNPYSKAWGLNLSRLKPGDKGLTKLYLNEAGEDGKEKYLLIAAHYLKDLNMLNEKEAKEERNRIRTGSNRWEEARLYPHIDLSYMRERGFYKVYTALFEWDDLQFQADILRVPENLLYCFLNGCDDEEYSQQHIFIMYVRKKTTPPKGNPRIYTNNPDRMGRLVTKGFRNVCKIDEVITDLTLRGWIIGTDNLCMNDFSRIYQNLRMMSK